MAEKNVRVGSSVEVAFDSGLLGAPPKVHLFLLIVTFWAIMLCGRRSITFTVMSLGGTLATKGSPSDHTFEGLVVVMCHESESRGATVSVRRNREKGERSEPMVRQLWTAGEGGFDLATFVGLWREGLDLGFVWGRGVMMTNPQPGALPDYSGFSAMWLLRMFVKVEGESERGKATIRL